MQDNRNPDGAGASSNLAPALPATDRVRGVGVCDVLRIELEACQLEVLRAELDAQRRVLDDAIALARDEDALDALHYARRVLAALAHEARANGERIVVWGPARTMTDLVVCAARSAAERLVDALAGPQLAAEPDRRELTGAARGGRMGGDLRRRAGGGGLQLRSRHRSRPVVSASSILPAVGPGAALGGWTESSMRLDPADIDAIARAVAAELREQAQTPSARLVDAGELAKTLGVRRSWVYAHANDLGAVRLGGPRGRMRFDLDAVQRRLSDEPVRRRPRSVTRRGTKLGQPRAELLPIDP